MQTLEDLEERLNKLVSKLGEKGLRLYEAYQEKIVDNYDEFDDKQLLNYYRALILKAKDLIYDGYDAKSSCEEDADLAFISRMYK